MRKLSTLILAASLMTPAVAVGQGAIITNGTIKLGVLPEGPLGVFDGSVFSVGGTLPTGLRFLTAAGEYESTAPGCICEGWGVGISGGVYTGVSGYANVAADGVVNLALVSFVSDASSATSITRVKSGGTDLLEVTHFYRPSSVPNLYEVTVTIRNLTAGELGSGATGIRYRRVMDWDIEPTAFSEYTELSGWPATALIGSSNDGFMTGNPFGAKTGTAFCGGGPFVDVNFSATGPCDHGALFDFGFSALGAEESMSFTTFYGAATTRALVLAALGAVGAEVYSIGSCSTTPDCPAYHTFAFEGVGGTPVPPPPTTVPEPSTVVLLVTGLAAMGAVGVRRRKKSD